MMSCFFFFKQKTAYEMRISDWSSDVCSSDLLFVAFFWSLWEQSNGQTWVLQAQSDLMDKHISIFGLFSFDVLPAQIQSVNALFIPMLEPVFSYGIYPFVGCFVAVTPLRKIAAGLSIGRARV